MPHYRDKDIRVVRRCAAWVINSTLLCSAQIYNREFNRRSVDVQTIIINLRHRAIELRDSVTGNRSIISGRGVLHVKITRALLTSDKCDRRGRVDEIIANIKNEKKKRKGKAR